MAYKIRLFALEHDYTEPVFMGKVNATKEEPYSDLRPRLGKACVVEWPFDFWDVEDGLRIRKQLEPLNEIGDIVHVIRVAPVRLTCPNADAWATTTIPSGTLLMLTL